MKLARDILICLLLATATAAIAVAGWELGRMLEAFARAPVLLADRVTELEGSLGALPDKLLPPTLAEVRRQADGLRDSADSQITALRGDVMERVDRLSGTVEGAVAKADGQLTGLRSDLSPVLVNAAALTGNSASLVKDAQDSLDDAYPDVRGLLESSTVAATQIAQTAETVRAAAPQMIATGQETNRQFAGIATDVHKFTTRFTTPVSWKTRIWEGFKATALLGSRILP